MLLPEMRLTVYPDCASCCFVINMSLLSECQSTICFQILNIYRTVGALLIKWNYITKSASCAFLTFRLSALAVKLISVVLNVKWPKNYSLGIYFLVLIIH